MIVAMGVFVFLGILKDVLLGMFIYFCTVGSDDSNGLLLTNFLDLDIFEMLYDLYAISKYVKL